MNIRWSSQRDIANNKLVKSSAIWLVIVPFAAKVLLSLDDSITFIIFGGKIELNTSLPFMWQLLFIAAIFFTIAGIIYSIFCPELVKKYTSFTEFENDGKTRLQLNHALKELAWDYSKSKIKKEHLTDFNYYFRKYSNEPLTEPEFIEEEKFDSIEWNQGRNSNAFYYIYELSDKYRQKMIWLSLSLYLLGFAHIGVIAFQNILYVAKTMG